MELSAGMDGVHLQGEQFVQYYLVHLSFQVNDNHFISYILFCIYFERTE